MLALAVAASASAHDVSSPAGHAAEDAVTLSAAGEQRLNQQTLDASKAPALVAAAATAGTPADIGQWGPVVDWPVVAINSALLPNGRVLAYDSVGDKATESFPGQTFTRATVWDPSGGGQTDVRLNLGYNIFCSGFAHLMDGSLFIAGGNKDQQLNGIVNTTYFNPDTNQWSGGPNMAAGRWYPTVTALDNGEQLITSGGPSTPEVRQNDGTLRSLSTASLGQPLYPWFDVAPNGRAFYSGPDQTLRSLNPSGTGSWQSFQQRDAINRDYGGHAFFDVGKELVAGGGASTPSAEVIDVNGSSPTVASTAPMAFGRRQHNLTVLADGTVLATGGNSSGAGLVDLNAGVYNAELWNPATGTWRTLAAMQVTRQYHSTALLLPDGRVLSAGGGLCGICDQVGYLAKNAEIFSPPYLFDGSGNPATRPTITAAPSSVTYNQPFQVDTPNPSAIRKLALVRLGAVTHSVNMEQRYLPLSYTAGATALNATAPANQNIAPPGYYMLFATDTNGVPSIAKFIRIDLPPPPPQSGETTGGGASSGGGGASSGDGGASSGGGGGSSGGGGGSPGDATAARCAVRVPTIQPDLRKRVLGTRITCDVAASVAETATLTVSARRNKSHKAATKPVALGITSASVPAGHATTVKLALTRSGGAALLRAIRRRQRYVVRLSASATTPQGVSSTSLGTIRTLKLPKARRRR
ncbi:MAG: galactose oxidase-like domain-containing protein [Solirubrobacteraceae bacterium]